MNDRAVGFIDADAERLAVRVVNRGVERARDDERAQLRNGRRERQSTRNRGGGAQIFGLERAKEIDGMATLVAGRRHGLQRIGQGFHRRQTWLVRHGGKRPGVAERHRPEAPRVFPAGRLHAAIDVEDRHPIDRSSAELVRRAVAKLLELVVDRDDANVGGARDDDGRCPLPRQAASGRIGAAQTAPAALSNARREITGAGCRDTAVDYRMRE